MEETDSEKLRNSSSSSSTSSSQIDLDLQQDRKSNITILTDSSSENWTLRRTLKNGSKATSENINQISYEIENAPKPQEGYIAIEQQNVSSQAEISEMTENRHIDKLSHNKEIVRIRKASKFYGSGNNKQQVLSALDLSIREGDIYALLGASGCGKTTVLSSIIGLKKLDEGSLSVFGGVPGETCYGIPGRRVGYMPQELALFTVFTIEETFQYFGRIYGMKFQDVAEQTNFLSALLELPERQTKISKLSGGQQRRVSFAVSLVHKPELLILDEPTVGVDPVLRKSIWRYLAQLVESPKPEGVSSPVRGLSATRQTKRTTILITTHYIEEARQASVVGLMRNGALLAEENPSKLMETYNLTSLEDVFLKLCMRKNSQNPSSNGTIDRRSNQNGTLGRVCRSLVQNGLNNIGGNDTLTKYQGQLVYPGMTATLDDHSIQPISYARRNIDKSTSMRMNWTQAASYKRQASNYHNSSDETSSSCFCCPCLGRIWALVIKNLIKMKRNLSTLFFAFMLPAVQICFFCVAIGQKPSNLPFGVVNQEAQPFGSVCDFNDGCELKNFSCRYLSFLYDDPTLRLLQYKDMESAVKAVEEGTIWGTIHIGRNFTPALVKTVVAGIKADKDSRDQSQVEVRLDMSNQQIVVAIQQTLVDGFKKFSIDFMNDCGKIFGREGESSNDILPVVFGDPIYGKSDPVFVDFMIPGTIVLIIFFLAIGLTGEAFIQERKDGLLHRSWVAGVSPFEIVFAQIATQIFVLVGQTAVALLMTLVVFGISCEGSIGIVIAVTLLQGVAGMCYGFLLSTLFKEESTAMQAGVGSFYPLMMLSGILWPIEGMPTFLRKLSIYLPCTAATQSMRDVMTRGWGLEKPSVYLGLVSSSVWIAIFLISSWLVIRFAKW